VTIAVIIPARFESNRFPGKPLANIRGKPMIEWVIEKALRAILANKIIVATDDKRIYDFVIGTGQNRVEVMMTSKEHKSGTDRIAEVVKKNPEIKYIVNLQGDEPLLPSTYIDIVIKTLLSSNQSIVSLIAPITDMEDLKNPNVVKATMDKSGYALSFSRSFINEDLKTYYRHIGIYGYTSEILLQFNLLPPSPLEKKERLEQLRALENGIKIKLEVVEKAYPAVDRIEDIKAVEETVTWLNFKNIQES
jgi:3-deoxy-manno-octulosonate cytidylyltransferase (CMP-KDO synthetase)